MYNFLGLFVLLGGVWNFSGVKSQLENTKFGRGRWAAPSCSCPIGTNEYIFRQLLSSRWKMEIRAGDLAISSFGNGVLNDPNSIPPNSYRATDCLQCPGGPSGSPGPAGSCPSASYNYLSSPKATTWLKAQSGRSYLSTDPDERIVITDISPAQPFTVKRLEFKVKRAASIRVDLFVGGTKVDWCGGDIWPEHNPLYSWTKIRCNFCGNLNGLVDKMVIHFYEGRAGDAVGIKKLKIWACEH